MLTTSAPSTFGDLLRDHRQAAGLTQQQLAERAGLSVHGIQKLERGATHPYRDPAQRLIAALQLEADDKSSFEARLRPCVDTAGRLPLNRPLVGAITCRSRPHV